MAKSKFNVTLHDGKTIVVQPTLEDTLAFETALRKNPSWGGLKDSVLKMQPFRAWNFLRRTGQTELSWEEFTKGDLAALDVSSVEEDADDELEVEGVGKGSRTGAVTSSSSSSPSVPESPTPSGAEKPVEPPKS